MTVTTALKTACMKRQAMTAWACVCLGVLSICLLGACNTVDGAGEDMEAAGEAVQDAAD